MIRSLSRSVTGAVVALVGSAGFTVARAQFAVSPFLSYTDAQNALSPTGVGVTGALYFGPLGLRGGGAVVLDPQNRLDAGTARGWDMDADLILRLASPGRGTGMALVPYGFVGAGTRGRPGQSSSSYSYDPSAGITYPTRTGSGTIVTTDTRSYGAGVNLVLGGGLELMGEARWRVLRDQQSTSTWDWRSAGPAEMRLGVSIRFGG